MIGAILCLIHGRFVLLLVHIGAGFLYLLLLVVLFVGAQFVIYWLRYLYVRVRFVVVALFVLLSVPFYLLTDNKTQHQTIQNN